MGIICINSFELVQLGILYYRFGDLHRAEFLLKQSAELSIAKENYRMAAIALSNLAMVQSKQDNLKDALRNGRSAIEYAQKAFSKRCDEVILLLLIIMCYRRLAID